MFSMFGRWKKKKKYRKLTEKEIEEFEEGFKLFDVDNDGSITSEDLAEIMRTLGLNPTEAEIRDLIETVDRNNNGKIEINEFLEIMEMGINGSFNTEMEMHRLFRVFDKNGNGFISSNELRTVMSSLGEKLTDEEINAMIGEADLDGDGKINYAEFVKMMK